MRIIWLADFTLKTRPGGAQVTNQTMINYGRKKRKLEIVEVDFEEFKTFKFQKGDVAIINNIAKINQTSLKNLSDKQLSEFRNKHIGFIFQFHQLLPEFTALENVCIPAFIAKRPKKEAEIEAKKVLDFLGLSHRLHHKPNELSGGEQQRVAVARALINNPNVILADEPSGNLDSESAKNLHELFFKLRDEFGQTFVLVTHNEELANMADRKLTMIDGKMTE